MKLYKRKPYIPVVFQTEEKPRGFFRETWWILLFGYLFGVWIHAFPSPSKIIELLDLLLIQVPPVLFHKLFL